LAGSEARQAVSARGIAKSFGRQKALDELWLEIPSGLTYCLLGPNGSGKTTFIRAVVGLLRLDGGDLQVLGQPVGEVARLYSRIGYMTQHKALYPDLTVEENIEFYAGLYSLPRKQREERMEELLRMVGLFNHRGRLAGALSGGMYQRLSLACTLIHQPELLLLDEPTVGVDPRLRQTFWEYFNRMAEEGKTVLITTHLMDEAESARESVICGRERWRRRAARRRSWIRRGCSPFSSSGWPIRRMLPPSLPGRAIRRRSRMARFWLSWRPGLRSRRSWPWWSRWT